ncbi:MAG TPA: urea ABC transporter permease subunit UrtB, partial [bacterium]|nr:urea ABC transporter permease subunit UrtB [bacterium]
DWGMMAHLTARQAVETDPKVKAALAENADLLAVKDPAQAGPQALLSAVKALGRDHSLRSLSSLQALVPAAQDPALRKALASSIAAIDHWQWLVNVVQDAFSGLSLGSILVLMALGLSIIFGLMGVINMAHGELMTMGAYTGFLMQEAFHRWAPGAQDWYLPCAIPLAFLTAGAVGYLMEALIIRHLYGRPLETLLATWGVSLCLIQAVRLVFGDNQAVNSPTWLVGGLELFHGVVLPYNRCFIILLCGLSVAFTYAVIGRTKFGLLIRATTQNRTMASSLGVNMRRVDALTFAFGAGLAGVAGCALTQVGGITPDMGSNYIVDSFLVVVTGGVGKLAGAVWAGFGLGCLNKFLEPFVQAVWGKVLILLFVVVFIQWRPSGLFPAKGRAAND